MKLRLLLSWPVVVTAALALLLGSVGTATASGLTKHAVKKIAAKVVKKSAPGLSVAHAATSSDASNLAGQAPATYQNNVIRYLLTTSGSSADRAFTLSGLVPGGTYEFAWSISIAFASAPSGGGSCHLETTTTPAILGIAYTNILLTSGSDVSQVVALVGPSGAVTLRCNEPANFTVHNPATAPSYATARRVDNLTDLTSAGRPGGPVKPLAGAPALESRRSSSR